MLDSQSLAKSIVIDANIISDFVQDEIKRLNVEAKKITNFAIVIKHTSYGRIYIRWRNLLNKAKYANYSSMDIPLREVDKPEMEKIQNQINMLNLIISMSVKRKPYSS
jgi:hypothetical protein